MAVQAAPWAEAVGAIDLAQPRRLQRIARGRTTQHHKARSGWDPLRPLLLQGAHVLGEEAPIDGDNPLPPPLSQDSHPSQTHIDVSETKTPHLGGAEPPNGRSQCHCPITMRAWAADEAFDLGHWDALGEMVFTAHELSSAQTIPRCDVAGETTWPHSQTGAPP